MPQFDFVVYFTYFFTFFSYILILYFCISLFIMPYFWSIINLRYIKKEINKFLRFFFYYYYIYFRHILDVTVIRVFYLFAYVKRTVHFGMQKFKINSYICIKPTKFIKAYN
jgi:hypothetical protein|nr:hypothetical protein [Actinophrys sol]